MLERNVLVLHIESIYVVNPDSIGTYENWNQLKICYFTKNK